MKLAFCLFKYFPYGGLQRDFLRIAKTCAQRGHDVHVYTMQWDGEATPELTVHLINVRGIQNHTRSRHFAKQTLAAIHADHYDLVIGFNKMPGLDVYYAADVCYKTRAQAKHGFLYRLLPRYKHLIEFEQAVFAKGKKTEILLISPLQQPEFMRSYHTEAQRFHLLPPGIAKDRMAPANANVIRAAKRRELSITENDLLILMVGSGFKTKGVDRAILAIASLPPELKSRAHLIIVGQDRADTFQQLAEELGVSQQVAFLGGRPDIPAFLLAADILLHPAYHENTGTVLLEAMVAGLPVLTIDVCGYAHFIQEANAGCVLTSPFKQADLNHLLAHMLSSTEQRNTWQQHALTFAKQADIYSLPEKAADVIEQKGLSRTLSFAEMMGLRGEAFRHLEGRLTQRVKLNGKTYFIKQHSGVGWKEIFKNLLQLRLPILGAKNESLALNKLTLLGISVPQVISFEQRGINPARLQSYILMEELTQTISLEDLTKTWQQQSPPLKLKRQLIAEVARMARIMHQHGLNHRDFYICHFLLNIPNGVENIDVQQLKLSLIDLHRAQIRSRIPERWIIKDLAGLYFSSKDSGLTLRDRLRFVKGYRNKPLREILKSERTFWHKVITRGEQLYRDHLE